MKRPSKVIHNGKANRAWRKFYKMEKRRGRIHLRGKGRLFIGGLEVGSLSYVCLEGGAK